MNVTIHIPAMLRAYCPGTPAELVVPAVTVKNALESLAVRYPRIYDSICNEAGAVRRHINLFVNSELVPQPDGLDTPLMVGDELFIMTAVSGG